MTSLNNQQTFETPQFSPAALASTIFGSTVFCVLQRDVQGWRHEAGRMVGYYNNAILILGIVDVINYNVGFLHKRHQHYSPPIAGDDGEFYHLRETLPDEYDLNVSSWISKRAWTLQERLLSPHVFYFTRD
jgi:hypothetical protein